MASAHPLTDHREIRRWAETRGAQPACVKGTGRKGDTGMIRLDFPGFSGAGSLQAISWNDWFKSFDDNNLALLVQDETARGQQSNFNKLVARRPAEGKQQGRRAGASGGTRRRAARSSRGGAGRTSASGKSTAARRRSTAAARHTAADRHTSSDRARSRTPKRSAGARARKAGRSRRSRKE